MKKGEGYGMERPEKSADVRRRTVGPTHRRTVRKTDPWVYGFDGIAENCGDSMCDGKDCRVEGRVQEYRRLD